MDEKKDITAFAEKLGVVVSRVSHPHTVPYGDGHIVVSPRSVTKPLLRRLLPTRLPEGLSFIPR